VAGVCHKDEVVQKIHSEAAAFGVWSQALSAPLTPKNSHLSPCIVTRVDEIGLVFFLTDLSDDRIPVHSLRYRPFGPERETSLRRNDWTRNSGIKLALQSRDVRVNATIRPGLATRTMSSTYSRSAVNDGRCWNTQYPSTRSAELSSKDARLKPSAKRKVTFRTEPVFAILNICSEMSNDSTWPTSGAIARVRRPTPHPISTTISVGLGE
jgi:hypothetical protein